MANKLFGTVKLFAPKVNKFDLSHMKKFSVNMGFLVPVMVQEILPGDRFRVATEIMIRFAPMLAPPMHQIDCYLHSFYVPNRLVYEDFEELMTGGRTGTETPPVSPYFRIDSTDSLGIIPKIHRGSLADFMGVPTPPDGVTGPFNQIDISAIPFRAYQLIYDEYFRDQNVTPELDIDTGSGAVTGAEIDKLLTARKRAWEKDYFTSALPFAQRGNPVGIPVTGDATWDYSSVSHIINSSTGVPVSGERLLATSGPNAGNLNVGTNSSMPYTASAEVRVENLDNISLSSVSVLIEELRVAARMQEFLERMAVGGARYTEFLRAVFGVVSSDARLNRPEYLGGSKHHVVISEVLSTVETAETPQGEMAGHGIAVGYGNRWGHFFEEHGYVITLMSVLPRTAYQQGLPKHLTRFGRFDYMLPPFVHLGEQEVLNKELYLAFAAADGNNDGVFGYQSRYADYKYQASTVHGDFKDSLAFWHMGRIFDSMPALNTEFIESDPTNRIFAVTGADVDHLYCQVFHRVDALRPLPYYGTPRL